MSEPMFIDNSPIDGRKIRKVWHHDEWWYSAVDIVSELTNSQNPRQNWNNLKRQIEKEGNRKLAGLQLKLPALDGKMRLTDVVNTEQALRVVQSIPSPKAEPMKLWLAEVGAQKLEETENPELAVERSWVEAEAKYRREGKSESWIEARKEGMVARKQFVEALKSAVLDAIPLMYAQATDKLYQGLWERTTAQLRGELNLLPKQNPRDHFGKFALIYTRLAEEICSVKLGDSDSVFLRQAMEIVWEVAKAISKQAKATSEILGMDLVTEKPLLRG